MNPLRWVRWKVLGVLAVLGGVFYFLGLNPLARWQFNKVGASGQAGARFSVEEIALGLLQGRSTFTSFQLATAHAPARKEASGDRASGEGAPGDKASGGEARERVAQADELVCDLSMVDLLSRRFAVDELSVKKPLLKVQRRPDGSVNIEDLGEEQGEEKPAPSKERKVENWVKALEEWMEKARRRAEERRKKTEEAGREEEPGVAREKKKQEGRRADYTRMVSYPFEKNPRVVVTKASAEALEIQFEDETGAMKPPALRDAKVEVLNLSDRPEHQAEPIRFSISGTMGGGTVSISGTVDLRWIRDTEVPLKKDDLLIKVEARGLPLKDVAQAFAGSSLDVEFEKGTLELNAEVGLVSLEKLSVRSPSPDLPLFALRGVAMKARPRASVAGLDGAEFCRVVNEVGELEVHDLEIGGTLASPEFRWGEGIKKFILSGGKELARKKAQEAAEKGTGKARELLQDQLKRNPDLKKAGDTLDKGGLGQGAAEKSLQEGVGGALDGLFGKKKAAPPPKKEEPAAPPAPAPK